MTADDHVRQLVRDRDRDRYLATLYAPEAARAALFALHALDLELAEVVRTTSEPMLGQIRLAWWREQFQSIDAGSNPSQPTLAALARALPAHGIAGAELETLEDANLALLEGDDFAAYMAARGKLFVLALRALGVDDDQLLTAAERAGAGWAAVEAMRTGDIAADPASLDVAAAHLTLTRAAPGARPVLALAALARRDLARLRAGKPLEPRGTPGRQARLLWSIVAGR